MQDSTTLNTYAIKRTDLFVTLQTRASSYCKSLIALFFESNTSYKEEIEQTIIQSHGSRNFRLPRVMKANPSDELFFLVGKRDFIEEG